MPWGGTAGCWGSQKLWRGDLRWHPSTACSSLSFKLLLTYSTACYKLSMRIKLTIFDISIKEKRVNVCLCFEFLLQQISQSIKKYIDLCQHANKYKQVVLETLF